MSRTLKDARPRLSQLHRQMQEPEEKAERGKAIPGKKVDPHPPHGTRGDFVKWSVTLPPVLVGAVMDEVTRRQMFKLPNATKGAVLREAVAEWAAKRSV